MIGLLLLVLFGSQCDCCHDILDKNESGNGQSPYNIRDGEASYNGSLYDNIFGTGIVDVYDVRTYYSTVSVRQGDPVEQEPLYTIRLFELEDPSVPVAYGKVVIRNVPSA